MRELEKNILKIIVGAVIMAVLATGLWTLALIFQALGWWAVIFGPGLTGAWIIGHVVLEV